MEQQTTAEDVEKKEVEVEDESREKKNYFMKWERAIDTYYIHINMSNVYHGLLLKPKSKNTKYLL